MSPGTAPISSAPSRAIPAISGSTPAVSAPPATPPTSPTIALRDAVAEAWPTAEPTDAGLDRAALERIIGRAQATETSSLLILQDGKIVVERYFGGAPRPIETMSMTKSLVSIAIGILLDDKKIASLDAPLSTWFPELKKGKKALITLRHVMTHTSGLAHGNGAYNMNKEKDRLAYALSREVVKEPGSTFSYSNEATQILAGVVAKAAGQPLDELMRTRVFEPLGITDFRWAKDGAGTPQAFYGAALRARDLAKIGQLMLDGGRWSGRSIVSSDWVRTSTTAAPTTDYHAHLWWLRFRQGQVSLSSASLTKLEEMGFSGAKKLSPLADKRFPATQQREALWLEIGALLDAKERAELTRIFGDGLDLVTVERGRPFGFAADGWLGQQLLVVPNAKLVVVRQHEAPDNVTTDDAYNQRVGYFGLIRDVELALIDKGS